MTIYICIYIIDTNREESVCIFFERTDFMAESKPFETAVETVNSKLAKTKHLHLKTKKIIEEGNLKTALTNIQKKNVKQKRLGEIVNQLCLLLLFH